MAKTIHDESGQRVIEISRKEAAELISNLVGVLAVGGGPAPQVVVMRHGVRDYTLFFQLEQVDAVQETSKEDRG